MTATFHNHSTWSDGAASVGELYAQAESIDIDLLGVSDHFCVTPDGTVCEASLNPGALADYAAEVRSFNGKGGPEVIVGAEFDWFDGAAAQTAAYADSVTLDYRIGSIHYIRGEAFDIGAAFWRTKTDDEINALYAAYWRSVCALAESRLFDVMGHLDLPKKFGFQPKTDLHALENEALDAIRACGLTVELNTAGFRAPCGDAYPSLDLLKRCRSRDIPVTLSADAHRPDQLLAGFDRGLARLREAGYTSLVRFRERTRWSEPLDDALPC